MRGPLNGIKVVEVANFLAVPSCAALMADMGAEVVKIEPHTGDPYRWFDHSQELGMEFPINYAFELDNRGKRSVALDLERPESAEIIRKLADEADVFVTNLIPRRMVQFRLRYEDLSPSNPRLVYLALSGYGARGPDKDKLGFDHTAFWTGSGIMSFISELANEPIDLQNGMGDHTTSPLLLSGVLAALYERERSGKGQLITTSLLNMGLWVLGADVQETLAAQKVLRRRKRIEAEDPLINTYRTGDDRWFLMVMPDSDANWAKLCRALGREDLMSDPRSSSIESRRENAVEIIAELDGTIGARTLEELAPHMDANDVIFAPMRNLLEALNDPQVEANDMLRTLEHPNHGPYQILNTPMHFGRSEVGPKAAAPEIGQHTEEVLLELGYDWEQINRLQDEGVTPSG